MRPNLEILDVARYFSIESWISSDFIVPCVETCSIIGCEKSGNQCALLMDKLLSQAQRTPVYLHTFANFESQYEYGSIGFGSCWKPVELEFNQIEFTY